MCYQVKHVYACGCPAPQGDIVFRACSRVEHASLDEKVTCAITTQQTRIERVNTRCNKCLERMKRHLHNRHFFALQEFRRAVLAKLSSRNSDHSELCADQPVFVEDESWALKYRMYNLAKKHGVAMATGREINFKAAVERIVSKIDSMTLGIKARSAAEVQMVQNKIAAERKKAGLVAEVMMTEAMQGLTVSSSAQLKGTRKRKAEGALEESDTAKKSKSGITEVKMVEDADADADAGMEE